MTSKFKIVVAIMLSLLLVHSTTGYQPRPIDPLPSEAFKPVLVTPSPTILSSPNPSLVPVIKPAPSHIIPKLIPTITKPKTILTLLKISGRKTSGVASWYCLNGVSRCSRNHPDGKDSYFAAIRRDLLFLRGRKIQVCEGSKCLGVTIIDCNCGKNANLIDLYSDAFSYFYPLSKGAFKVTIRW